MRFTKKKVSYTEYWDSIYIRAVRLRFRNDFPNPNPLIFSRLTQNFQTFTHSDYPISLSYIYITHATTESKTRLQTIADSEQSPLYQFPLTLCVHLGQTLVSPTNTAFQKNSWFCLNLLQIFDHRERQRCHTDNALYISRLQHTQ